MNTIRVSNSLDPDQARRSVGPDLGTNCLQRLSADDTSRQRANTNRNGIFDGNALLTADIILLPSLQTV